MDDNLAGENPADGRLAPRFPPLFTLHECDARVVSDRPLVLTQSPSLPGNLGNYLFSKFAINGEFEFSPRPSLSSRD